MKPTSNTITSQKNKRRHRFLIIGLIILLLQAILDFTVSVAQVRIFGSNADAISTEIQQQLDNSALLQKLNFPKSVKRFYGLNMNQAIWLAADGNSDPTASAIILLDHVEQYGLQGKKYHPEILHDKMMREIWQTTRPLSLVQKIEFEILLTDALISIINDLHYGGFNPFLPSIKIDSGMHTGLRAEVFLNRIKDSDSLMDSIIRVQPQLEAYQQLQSYVQENLNQAVNNSNESAWDEINMISMNLERLRWSNINRDNYILINIPSFELFYHTVDSTYLFKVVIGKKITPTPLLTSDISHLETAPDWQIPNKIFIKELLPKAIKNNAFFENNQMAVYDLKSNFIPINPRTIAQIKQNSKKFYARQSAGCDNALGKVVFRFNNSYTIYLHDTPEQSYFSKIKRTFSHGCIRVEKAELLATLLLKNDGQTERIPVLKKAMDHYTKKRFNFRTNIPIIVTYLTITVLDKQLHYHEDIYGLDKLLKEKMFGV
ncbi:L,D-transpeptidase family protein [Sphingobacterium faecium]|uniref:L,D-transpeptidase family protein n=1 Tax=Sphingobacterium faecium TaxID=34087 RepID=UPI00320AD034